ncbi:hypothetical protein [Segetibacter aerophilus]|uniref:Uncharacterized protein n=1 Tax=Segetibacter aerophilus TaxID=670293 RepID=A0A512B978_9BACT|nr:hypothetical protein [Segetibacter aerophilus]GEO08505.1 hypothetical protein SAE01_10010 [Segetibacter aerophilus]
MSTNDNEAAQNDATNNRSANKSMKSMLADDIHDSPQDEEKMKSETVIIDLPDVSDIPGQENIVVPNIGEMQDTTISSDDEEGLGLFGDDEGDEDTDLVMGTEADVSETEQTMLKRADEDMPDEDDPLLRQAELDNTDDEGDVLNEGSLATDVGGGDLDTATNEEDLDNDALGQGDEENASYSLGSDSNDDVTEGTP